MTHRGGPVGWLGVAAASAAALGIAIGCDGEYEAPSPDRDVAPAEDGVAVGIVYDTSGSMKEEVENSAGKDEPKYQIARRALDRIVDRLAVFAAAPAEPPRKVHVGLYVFTGPESVEALVPLGPFSPAGMRDRIAGLGVPEAGTPLGWGLTAAAADVLASPLSRRHVLVITDGVNTAGPEPAAILPGLLARGRSVGPGLSVHFVAFDVDAALFEPVKRLGVTVVAATDERTLEEQLGFIVDRKILLEDEEPAAAVPAGPK